MNIAIALAVAVFPFVSAAPAALAEHACNATGFSSGHYSLRESYVKVTASGLKAGLGQTLTATVVVSHSDSTYFASAVLTILTQDIATCTPYTGTDVALQTLSGSAFDRDFVYLPEQGIPSSGNTVTSNIVSWVAAVPNGSKNLDLSVTAQFTPGVSLFGP